MRVLLYNFVQPEDPAHKQGGGVAVYQESMQNRGGDHAAAGSAAPSFVGRKPG
jgi:hypothetical protein